jgi:hypothetical protein
VTTSGTRPFGATGDLARRDSAKAIIAAQAVACPRLSRQASPPAHQTACGLGRHQDGIVEAQVVELGGNGLVEGVDRFHRGMRQVHDLILVAVGEDAVEGLHAGTRIDDDQLALDVFLLEQPGDHHRPLVRSRRAAIWVRAEWS